MIGSYSKELKSYLGFVAMAVLCFNALGVEGLKNGTFAHSPVMQDSLLSGVSVLRLAPFTAHTQRRYRDGSIHVGEHPCVRSTQQAEWNFLCLRSDPQHPEPSSESSMLR